MINDPNHSAAQNSFLIVMGSAIAGTIAAALIPRSARERATLGPIGRQLRRRVHAAAQEAQDVTIERLDKLGINRDFADAQLRGLAQNIAETAVIAGVAALKAAREKKG